MSHVGDCSIIARHHGVCIEVVVSFIDIMVCVCREILASHLRNMSHVGECSIVSRHHHDGAYIDSVLSFWHIMLYFGGV